MQYHIVSAKKADIQKIEAMKVVKGRAEFQGNTVSDFYNDFTAVAGIEGVSKDAVKSATKQNQKIREFAKNFRSPFHCGRFDFGIQKLH